MVEIPLGLVALVLVITANAVPWLLDAVLGARGAWPIDRGLRLRDHRRLLGSHKTWRGLLGGMLATALVGVLFGLDLLLGAAFGALALLGDALASFLKRRLDLQPGTEVPGLDQLPEALLPLVVLAEPLELSMLEVAVIAFTFMIFDIVSVRVRHRD